MSLFLAILLFFIFAIATFFTWFVVVFIGNQIFYEPFVLIFSLGLYTFAVLGIYRQFKHKMIQISFVLFLLAGVISVGVYEGYQAYQRSLIVASEQDVNLYDYMPFAEGSLAVQLEEESTLRITENLPRLDGSTALYPLYSAFVQAVYPKKEYNYWNSEVMSSQTSGAYKRLIHGDADIIFVPKPAEAHLELAKEYGVPLHLTPIAKEAFVFFVNTGNPVESLTTEQIKKIYSGEYVNWQEVGGVNKQIHAFQRPENSGSQQALHRFMGEVPIMEPSKEKIAAGMGRIIEETARYKNYNNAIGYSFRFFTEEVVRNGEVRNLAIDGIAPTIENIVSGTYPIVDEFYAVTLKDAENPHIEDLLEWILSEQGQLLVEKTGYAPIN